MTTASIAPSSASSTKPRRTFRSPSVLAGIAGLVVLVLLWGIGAHSLSGSMPLAEQLSPQNSFAALARLLGQSELPAHALTSLRRVFVGLALALVIGIPIGLAVGSSRWFDNSTQPAFQFLRMISPLSWMPIAVMIFGIGDAPIYFLLTFAAVWPIILNTAAGVRNLNPQWLQLSRSMSATRFETLRTIVLPGVLSHILTGLRLSIGISWILLVPCEMLGVSSGLGYFILDTRDRLAYSELMAGILFIGLLGFVLDYLAQALYRHFTYGKQTS
ncbi:ABC transporter permease [Advenella kashmirensis W13003]|uniref:ABC transporter permease n=1 Tax=Advenella kashmirensis W13003 TaxID=1424334 RepID=V8QTB1_9BURK|nr:ABC transporter permease [Advenella kashmirensis]ETF02249.1 ABC transporter permease [Advenella kashmirensis W13003]